MGRSTKGVESKTLHSCTSKMCNYQIILFLTPRCKVQSAKSCTFAPARFCILTYQNMQVPRHCVFHPLHARFKVQDFADLHVQDFAFLHIKNVQVPSHSVFNPLDVRCKVQDLAHMHMQ